jgi:hypothetical protein
MTANVNSERLPNTWFEYWELFDEEGTAWRYSNDRNGGYYNDDGSVKVGYLFIPLVLSREYVFGGGSPLELRIGPSVGLGILQASISRSPTLDDRRNTFSDETKATWLVGVSGGLTWYISRHERFSHFLSLEGSFYFAGKLKYDFNGVELPGGDTRDLGTRSVNLTGGRIALTYGWRF